MRGSYNSDPCCVKLARVLVIQPALLPSKRGSDSEEPRHREAMLGLTDLIPSLPRCRLASPVNPARRQDGAGSACYTRAASIHSGSAIGLQPQIRVSVKAMKVAHAGGARLAVISNAYARHQCAVLLFAISPYRAISQYTSVPCLWVVCERL